MIRSQNRWQTDVHPKRSGYSYCGFIRQRGCAIQFIGIGVYVYVYVLSRTLKLGTDQSKNPAASAVYCRQHPESRMGNAGMCCACGWQAKQRPDAPPNVVVHMIYCFWCVRSTRNPTRDVNDGDSDNDIVPGVVGGQFGGGYGRWWLPATVSKISLVWMVFFSGITYHTILYVVYRLSWETVRSIVVGRGEVFRVLLIVGCGTLWYIPYV